MHVQCCASDDHANDILISVITRHKEQKKLPVNQRLEQSEALVTYYCYIQ